MSGNPTRYIDTKGLFEEEGDYICWNPIECAIGEADSLVEAATAAGIAKAVISKQLKKKCAEEIPKYSRNKYKRLTDKQRKDVLERDPDCVYCDKNPSETVDHVRSQKQDWAEGGYRDSRDVRSDRVNDPSNLRGSCGSCNSSKGSKELGTEWTPPNQR